jgi:hypothetical protein
MSQYEDAQLILQFYDLRREPRLRAARAYVTGSFHVRDLAHFHETCPPGTDENAFFRQVTSYWDMVAAIAKRQVGHKELFFETNGELTVVWEKVRHLVPEMREAFGNPHFLANLEHVALEREAYLEEKAPGYLESLRKRLAP